MAARFHTCRIVKIEHIIVLFYTIFYSIFFTKRYICHKRIENFQNNGAHA